MTYYGGKELAAAFRTVRNNTIQIPEDIPEVALSAPEGVPRRLAAARARLVQRSRSLVRPA